MRLVRAALPRCYRTMMTCASTASSTKWKTQRASRIQEELNAGVDVWTLFNPAVFPTAINLGQGFMNWSPPSYILHPLTTELEKRVDLHHYSHPKGRLRLRQAISDFYSSQYGNKPLDVETEIQVTSGANGGIYSTVGAFINDGDRVVCIEPFFDQYNAEIVFHGGVPAYVPLLPPTNAKAKVEASEWTIDMSHLERELAHKDTKAIILNTPHNPVGKVFSTSELEQIAALCIKYDILVISDEVYDCLTFDGAQHVRIASLPGMWERTVTVGSAGKSFACTGWRVGWLIGPAHLISPARTVHTRITFAVNSGAQEGAALGLEQAETEHFFPTQIEQYLARRETLKRALDDIGLPHTNPHGGYFIMADVSHLTIPDGWAQDPANQVPKAMLEKPKDYLMAFFIAKICNVVVIPATAFYSQQGAHLGENFVRFSFCKDGQLEEAAQRLRALKPYLATA